jgi:hypothetical protein
VWENGRGQTSAAAAAAAGKSEPFQINCMHKSGSEREPHMIDCSPPLCAGLLINQPLVVAPNETDLEAAATANQRQEHCSRNQNHPSRFPLLFFNVICALAFFFLLMLLVPPLLSLLIQVIGFTCLPGAMSPVNLMEAYYTFGPTRARPSSSCRAARFNRVWGPLEAVLIHMPQT